MAKTHITIHDIARELNISASTVSRALRDHPRISKSTRQAVQEMASKFNYQPNVAASSLRSGKSLTVGVVVPRINRNFFSNVIGGMEEVLAASGYNLMICQTHEKLENEISALKTLVNARVDAILISVSMESAEISHIRAIQEKGTRVFFFDRVTEDTQAPNVVIDDRKGAYLSVKHLINQGYRRIVHLAGAGHINIYRDRRLGYRDALQEAGIEANPEWMVEYPLVIEGGEQAFEALMQHRAQPDAFFCAGDFAALGVLRAAQKSGYRIPEDLGVSGFANEPFTEFTHPSLTTVDQRGSEMGRLVAEMFMSCDPRNDSPNPCGNHIIEPRLIIRDSSKRSY